MSHLSKEEAEKIEPLLQEYINLFCDDPLCRGCLIDVKHKIDTGDHPPIKKMPYRLPEALKPLVQDEINKLLAKKIIRPSTSPWNSPVVVVEKKSLDGISKPKIRICCDYRDINSITKGYITQIPNIAETLDSLGKNKYFTTLDLRHGFHQVNMGEDDIEKTAFTV